MAGDVAMTGRAGADVASSAPGQRDFPAAPGDNGEAAAAQTTTDAAEPDALMANGSEPAPEPAPAPKPDSISPPAPSE